MNEVATRYSEACTRAGIAALVVAALSFSFTQRLAKVSSLEAYGSYVLGRELLDISLEELTTNQFWSAIKTELRADQRSIDTIAINELASLDCVTSNKKGYYARKRVPRTSSFLPSQPANGGLFFASANAQSVDARSSPTIPNPPNNLTAPPLPPSDLTVESSEPCPGVDVLQSALQKLWDDSTIAQARSFSDEANVELYRWELSRNRIVSGRITDNSVGDRSYQYINIQQIQKLNQHPRKTISEFATLVRDRMIVSSPYTSDQQSVTVASLLAEAAIFILVGYFFLNYRASQQASLLTSPATIFATLWTNTLGKLLYLLMLLLPALAAVQLASHMRGSVRIPAIGLAICSAAITSSLVIRFFTLNGIVSFRNVAHLTLSKLKAGFRIKT